MVLAFNKIDNKKNHYFLLLKKITIREPLVVITLKVSNNLQFS